MTGRTGGRRSTQYIFDGGVLSADVIASIRLQAYELSSMRFVEPTAVGELVVDGLAARIGLALLALAAGNATPAIDGVAQP
ncbi:MAG: hypothetical protein ACI8Y4_002339 [Candidatus Poriferisodalaceae bacterium]|jgi:hypothetical protein